MAKLSGDTTLGTDPWQGADETLFDRTGWDDRGKNLQDRLAEFGRALDSLSKRAMESEDEKRRLRAVVERLQSRVYDLEDELKAQRHRAATAKTRLLALKAEIDTWKTNEPLPST